MIRAETLARAERALRDPSRTRIVARARIKVPAHEDESPTLRTLEDALRAAEFDDCGRLVVMRTLVLPRFPVRASSAWVARAIEAAWRVQAAYAVHASTSEASSAHAVFFRDVTEARVELLQRLIGRGNADAWFWPLAVPEFVPDAARNEAVMRVLTVLVCDPRNGEQPGLTAFGTRIQRWSAVQLRTFVDALPAEPPVALAAYTRGPSSTPAQGTVTQARVPARAADADEMPVELRKEQHDVVRRLALVLAGVPLVRADDWRIVVLAEALVRANALSGATPVLHIVRELLRATASVVAIARADGTSHREAGSIAMAPQQEWASQHPEWPIPVADLHDDICGTRQPNPAEAYRSAAAAGQLPATAALSVRLPYLPWLVGAAATRFGGLLLVLNVLDRLGIDAWLALQPRSTRNSFVTLLLARIVQRLRVPNDDPHWELFAGALDPREALRDSACRWCDFEWPAWSGLERVAAESVSYETSVAHWISALRSVLRRRCRIGLASLTRRDAWLSVTATHVDIVFALEATDVRVRRVGLDGDPGWLPWFGRVVALHFVDYPRGGAPDA